MAHGGRGTVITICPPFTRADTYIIYCINILFTRVPLKHCDAIAIMLVFLFLSLSLLELVYRIYRTVRQPPPPTYTSRHEQSSLIPPGWRIFTTTHCCYVFTRINLSPPKNDFHVTRYYIITVIYTHVSHPGPSFGRICARQTKDEMHYAFVNAHFSPFLLDN